MGSSGNPFSSHPRAPGGFLAFRRGKSQIWPRILCSQPRKREKPGGFTIPEAGRGRKSEDKEGKVKAASRAGISKALRGFSVQAVEEAGAGFGNLPLLSRLDEDCTEF